MSTQDRRERDPLRLQMILARLARIKVARAARETEEVRASWEAHRENVIERAYLRGLGSQGTQEESRNG